MNSLKPLLIVAVLAGIGYGVYIRINQDQDAPPPPGVAEGWDTAPAVQMPDAAAGSPASWGSGGGANAGGIAAPFSNSRNPAGGAPRQADAPLSGSPQSAPPGAIGQGPAGDAPPFADSAAANPLQGEQPQAESQFDPAQSNASPPYDPRGGVPTQNAPAVPGYEQNGAVADSSGQSGQSPPGGADGFAAVMEQAHRALDSGQMAVALRELSASYDDPRLLPAEQQQLNHLLDQVAGTVVYSTQHLLEPPYEVRSGERLEDVGQQYNVPWQLLAKINGIDDPRNMRSGERLKVLRGPFQALISLEKRRLTLFLDDGSYAGSFPIGIGRDQPPHEGSFVVSDKSTNPVYRGRDRAVGPEDPNNPLGERWIGLGRELGIHGTNQPENIGRTDLPGSISLSPRDIEDVFDILSEGSRVTIRR